MLAHNADLPAFAGLVTPPLSDTARDTLGWLDAAPGATVTGTGRDREAELLRTTAP
jgi:2'-hydroxyisoflavone reductase